MHLLVKHMRMPSIQVEAPEPQLGAQDLHSFTSKRGRQNPICRVPHRLGSLKAVHPKHYGTSPVPEAHSVLFAAILKRANLRLLNSPSPTGAAAAAALPVQCTAVTAAAAAALTEVFSHHPLQHPVLPL
jgi:hypothetical protein